MTSVKPSLPASSATPPGMTTQYVGFRRRRCAHTMTLSTFWRTLHLLLAAITVMETSILGVFWILTDFARILIDNFILSHVPQVITQCLVAFYQVSNENLFAIYKLFCISVPFLLAYFKNFHTWFCEDNNKKDTFIFPFLNLYPQFGKIYLIHLLHISIRYILHYLVDKFHQINKYRLIMLFIQKLSN